MVSDDGYAVNVPHDEFSVTGRKSGGVIGMILNAKASVAYAGQLEVDELDGYGAGEVIFITRSGFAKRVFAMTVEPMKRARKGTSLIDVKSGDLLFAGVVTNAYDVAILTKNGTVKIVNTEDVGISRVIKSKGKPCDQATDGVCAIKHVSDI